MVSLETHQSAVDIKEYSFYHIVTRWLDSGREVSLQHQSDLLLIS